MTRINISKMQPLDFLKFSDPVDPQYFNYSPWRWLPLFNGDRAFPLIKPATPDAIAYYPIGDLGQDYDGSELGIIIEGPQKGCTVMITPPTSPEGKFIPPKQN